MYPLFRQVEQYGFGSRGDPESEEDVKKRANMEMNSKTAMTPLMTVKAMGARLGP
jgi:hypothetical protein